MVLGNVLTYVAVRKPFFSQALSGQLRPIKICSNLIWQHVALSIQTGLDAVELLRNFRASNKGRSQLNELAITSMKIAMQPAPWCDAAHSFARRLPQDRMWILSWRAARRMLIFERSLSSKFYKFLKYFSWDRALTTHKQWRLRHSDLARVFDYDLYCRTGVVKHFLRRVALKYLLLPSPIYYIYYIYNRFKNCLH